VIAQILGGKALPWAAGAALLLILGLGGLLRIEQLQRRAAEDAAREAQQQLLDAQAQVAQRNSQIKALERQALEAAATAARIEPIRREVHAAPRTSACVASPVIRAGLDRLRGARAAGGAGRAALAPGLPAGTGSP
jgi:hypothetical protein